jgi:Xaa-Pro aminopeptidase
MRSDLDRLMQEKGVDILMVVGAAMHNPAMVYFTGVAHVSDAILIKIRGGRTILFHYPMEREEAAKSGIELISASMFPMTELMKEAGGNHLIANALLFKKLFEHLGISSGQVALYGEANVGQTFSLICKVQELMPGLNFSGQVPDEILLMARMTKEDDELERIREMGRKTVKVVGRTADYLTSQRTSKDVLVHQDGSPVTIGEVKNLINLWLAEEGADNPEGTIFAQGRDAGIPHSVGTAQDPIRLGQTLIYDIYPCEAGGGYFYDFTRTWSLGYATDETQELFDQVKSVYDTLYAGLKLNQQFYKYQEQTCDLFEGMGHPTVKSTPTTEIGYCHSLGHGVGLNVHEKPWASTISRSPSDILVPGSVFTLEPGLYYPERGMGARIEDTLYVTREGKFEIMVDFPKDFILPIK